MSDTLTALIAEHDAKTEAMGRRYAVGAFEFSLALHDAATQAVALGLTGNED